MEQFSVATDRGTVICMPTRDRIISFYRKERFLTVDEVIERVFPENDKNIVSCINRRILQKDIADKSAYAYRKAYRESTMPTSTLELIHELDDRGVKVTDITIKCQTEGCNELCATSNNELKPLSEVAIEAAELSEFCDDMLICPACRIQASMERKLEDQAERLEARKSECYEYE